MQVVVLAVTLGSATAGAETIFRYHDPKTDRDVFVNQRDQIPVELRAEAQQVVADGVLVDSTSHEDSERPAGTVIYGERAPAGWWDVMQGLAHQAWQDRGRVDWQRALTTAVDTDLVRRGVAPLSADEVQQGLHLVVKTGWLLLAVAGVALAGWVWLMVQAWVGGQRAWAVLLLLCQPLSLLFALKFAEDKSRWWRAIMTLVQIAPYAAAALGATWVRAWFTAVLRSRGF
jgi:hypothetical protein